MTLFWACVFIIIFASFVLLGLVISEDDVNRRGASFVVALPCGHQNPKGLTWHETPRKQDGDD